jgi:nicotinamidase/pyrazinamidase
VSGEHGMAEIFWDVDTQHDFMRADGRLYVTDSEAIIPVLARLTDYAHRKGIRILASADDHEPGHRELSETPDWITTFPEHCMRGTPGQRKIAETRLRNPLVIEPAPEDPATLAARVRAHDGDLLFHKHWFDVFTNPNLLPVLDALAPSAIVLYGVALDVCNKYAVEGLLRHRPGLPITLVTDATRAIHLESSAALLEAWQRQGVHLATSNEVLAA